MRGIISLLASGNINKTKKLEIFCYFCQTLLGVFQPWCYLLFSCWLAGWLCALCLGRLWLAGTWLIILHILSYPRMFPLPPGWPGATLERALWSLNQPFSQAGGGGEITGYHSPLKTHTDHHIAHNNKTLNNTQKSSSISCSTEQIFSMPFYFSIAFICKLDFIFQRSKPILNQIFAFSLQVFVFLEVLRTISDSICYSDDIRGFCWREDGALTGRRSRGADIPGQQWGHHLEIVTADES